MQILAQSECDSTTFWFEALARYSSVSFSGICFDWPKQIMTKSDFKQYGKKIATIFPCTVYVEQKKSQALCLDIQTLKACNMLELVHLLLHISGSFHYCTALNTKQTLRSTYISLNHLYMLLCSLTLGCSLTNVVVLRFGTLLHHHFWSYWLFRRTFFVVEEGK